MAEPKVRFRRDDGGSYPAWRTIPMSEVFTEISEKNHPELPVLSVQQGVGTVLRDSSDRNILYDKSNLKNYKAMKKDDYIIHLRSFEGGLECSNYDGISSPAYRILRSQAIVPAAYKDYFRSYEFIHNKLAVSVVGIRDGKNIDMDTFWQIPMSVPCIEEQQKIADFLSSVDDVISTSEQEVANLETQKKAVMKKIFSQKVRFKRANGSDFPEWGKCKAVDCCKVFCDGDWIESKDQSESGIRLVQTGNVGNGIFVEKEARKRFISVGTFDRLHCTEIFAGDILISRLPDPAGRACIVPNTSERMITAVDCTIVRPDDSKLTTRYLVQFYQSSAHFKYVNNMLAGGTRQRVSRGNLEEEVVLLPCLEEQHLIADFLSSFDEAIAAAKKELELWKELKKGLLQQMFV